ncbi:ATP-binding protein [Cohnella ginsengisoli]|uniref:histidine kinase n=1 Tax=Cohnella ginsengisoli TaxID=425004 RepID=A0A9X4KLP1_9BACL|nr:ATP-binding protein [Cohnella ginsengisoli]MDG0794353.1 ATP-binding protein [Cohnella ginsengisoli]
MIGIASISRNITERKATEEMLRRTEKLSMVGQLAAGVAHEIRNPLTTLRGFVQLQQKSGGINPAHLDTMLSELDRINFIVGEFLVLSKPQAIRFQLVDIRSIMKETVALLEAQAIMNNVQFELREADELAPLNGEPNQLKQVFLNVLKNGMEAMPEGGTLRIGIWAERHGENGGSETVGGDSVGEAVNGRETIAEAAAAREPEMMADVASIGTSHQADPAADDNILIVIEDEGFGISQEELKHLGEPFYSNKASGHGLGLMVSQQILAGHRGTIRYKSELGQGTRVEIRLPY